MKKLTILLIISVLFCLNAIGQTNLLRISLGENHIDIVSTMYSMGNGITKVTYSSADGIEYFNAQVNETWDRIGNTNLINDFPFESLTDNTEQARTWTQCVHDKIYNCNISFWCELFCLH